MPLLAGRPVLENYTQVLTAGIARGSRRRVGRMMLNSLVMALVIADGQDRHLDPVVFAIVYFRFPLRNFFFWMIFVTLMLPVEVRIIPTFKVMADLGLLNTYAGLTLPLIASATATFLFRQFFMTIPDELAEAARIDGAGPMRFFWDVRAAAVQDQHGGAVRDPVHLRLEPVPVAAADHHDESMYTTVIGIKRMIVGGDAANEWNLMMATAMLAMLPPALVVLLMQKWFVKGLVETEK